jgi:hypothetical protein
MLSYRTNLTPPRAPPAIPADDPRREYLIEKIIAFDGASDTTPSDHSGTVV